MRSLSPAIVWLSLVLLGQVMGDNCPPSEAILPCRCSSREKEIQIWCSHSNLPQIMEGIKSVERNIKGPIDELVLENNQLPALPGRFFGSLQVVRLMLRYNSIERLSTGWLNELENSLVEVYIVEPQLRSIPVESLNGMLNMLAITIESDELKHLPDFSGLLSLTYLSVQSRSLVELQSHWFRHIPKVQDVHVNGAAELSRLEAGLFDGLISLKNVDLSRNGISWIHLRAFARLPNLVSLKLSHNRISDVRMIGRIVKDLENLKKLRLDHNQITLIEDGSFVDLPHLSELHLNDNRITEIEYGAFLRTPMLKTIYLHNNHIKRIHPESFLQASGSGVETMYIYSNAIEHVSELRSLLDALPALRFLDLSANRLQDIPYGALRGHGTLEQLHLNHNRLRTIGRDAFMAMPALRELRMSNNSLTYTAAMPFWNLPALKGLDLSRNDFRSVDSHLLAALPSLRRLDLSENGLQQMEANVFVHNPMLETLNISGNELSSVKPGTLRHLDRLFEVDASYNRLESLIPGLPPIVERVSLRGNYISQLPSAGGGQLELPNLRMLDLSANRLELLPKYSFQGVAQLRVLSLADNRLRSLDDSVFIGAKRLELLHLQDNELGQLNDRALMPLGELRNLNLKGNRLVEITDNLLWNNTRLEQLNLAHNQIRSITPAAFESQRSLEYLDLSGNALSDALSISLATLRNLKDIDLSYNKIANIQADIVSAWHNVVEVRLSNNLIVELKHGTFRNLPRLQYLDLSSNEINSVEPGALKNLTDLQEFVLADNKLVELKDHVFEDLPNLLASHFQYNALQYISPESFHNSPAMVFLNLSNNNFRTMENIGLRSMRNLEVLDLSTNNVQMVTTMPLRGLNWLVELKMDNNRICKIQGAPFESMPRLRVLSIRNNRLHTIKERTFRNLRGNIAILDVEGNPIVCSCEMQWLSVWLQETNFPFPGPKCQDGRLLRSSRIEKSLCSESAQRHGGGGADSQSDQSGSNQLPLLNEHGDIFQRQLHDDFTDECDKFDVGHAADRPLAGESEYFYDQYVDYVPSNESGTVPAPANVYSTGSPSTVGGASAVRPPPTPTINANIDLNNTILNTNYFKKRPGVVLPQSQSPFTFFGYPIPSLSLGRFFGTQPRERKNKSVEGGASATTASGGSVGSGSSSTVMPATHRMHHGGRSKVRMYEPSAAEFEKYLNEGGVGGSGGGSGPSSGGQYHDVTPRNGLGDSESNEASSESPRVVFKTAFREPERVEWGGFRPIMPGGLGGGFMPVHDPSRRGLIEAIAKKNTAAPPAATKRPPAAEQNPRTAQNQRPEKNFRPEQNQRPDKNVRPEQNQRPEQHHRPELPPRPPVLTTAFPTSLETETQTYYVTETPIENTTPNRPISVADVTPERASSDPQPEEQEQETDESEALEDLEAQSVGLMRPPPLVQTTTAETILLIPPPKEHEEQIKRHSWVTTGQPQPATAIPTSSSEELRSPFDSALSPRSTPASTLSTPSLSLTTEVPPPPLRSPAPNGGRFSGGRSTIVKVYTPQSLNHYLPTAEEYYRTTSPHSDIVATTEATLTQPQQGDSRASPPVYQVDRADRKDGMEWYYESFRKRQASGTDEPRHTAKRLPYPEGGGDFLRHSSAYRVKASQSLFIVAVLLVALNT